MDRRADLHSREKFQAQCCTAAAFWLSAVLSVTLISCGGSVSSAPASVLVSPSSAQPFVGTTVPFVAQVQNASNSSVTWQVNSIAGGNSTVGTIDVSGNYVAPVTIPSPASVTVTAVLQMDTSKSGSAIVTIQPPNPILGPLVISPGLSSVTTSQTLQLQVTNAGVTSGMVNWAATGGTINGSGLYSPPNVAGPYIVTAALKTNSSVLGTAQVKVTDFPGNLTWRNDNSRSGQNRQELALAPGTVSSSTFGKLFSCPVDGIAYAQPLYVANLAVPGLGTHNVIFVATEKDNVHAFDADAAPCQQLWKKNLVPSGEEAVPTPNLQISSDDIAPFVGISGTPVIDAATSTLYVVAKTRTVAVNPVYSQRLYALDLTTGQTKILPSGVQIASPGSVAPSFSALLGNQRAALLLDNGTVYVAFASHHDQGDYHGWIFAYDSATLLRTSSLDITPGGSRGGIWQSGGGPTADTNHNIFVVTGDGTFDVNRGGQNYGDSFLKMTAIGGLAVTDYFTPCNQATLDSGDVDLGASAAIIIPDSTGPSGHPNILIGGAKSGSLYVVDRDIPGGFTSGSCPDNPPRPLQVIPVQDGSILSTPIYWNSALYIAAGNGRLKAFPITLGVLATTPRTSQSPEILGSQGATPVISANGTINAVIWLIDKSGTQTTPAGPAILRAYDAGNLSNEIYNSATLPLRDSAGPTVKFTVPTVANGKVYVGTQTELDVYGLIAQ